MGGGGHCVLIIIIIFLITFIGVNFEAGNETRKKI